MTDTLPILSISPERFYQNTTLINNTFKNCTNGSCLAMPKMLEHLHTAEKYGEARLYVMKVAKEIFDSFGLVVLYKRLKASYSPHF